MISFKSFLLDNAAIAAKLINPSEIQDVIVWDGKYITYKKIVSLIRKWVDDSILIAKKGKNIVLEYLNGEKREIKINSVLLIYFGYLQVVNPDEI